MRGHAQVLKDVRWIDTQLVMVDLQGDFRLAAVPSSRKKLLQIARRYPRALVLNLAGVTTMDTAGIATLIEVLRMVQARGGRLILTGLHDQVNKMIQLTHLDQVVEVCDSVDAALAMARATSGRPGQRT